MQGEKKGGAHPSTMATPLSCQNVELNQSLVSLKRQTKKLTEFFFLSDLSLGKINGWLQARSWS